MDAVGMGNVGRQLWVMLYLFGTVLHRLYQLTELTA